LRKISLSNEKKKKIEIVKRESGEAKKLQSGYGKGHGMLSVSVTSFELFEAPRFAVGE
jgi:hypothetical protein